MQIPFFIRLSRPRFALYEFGTFWIGIFAAISTFSELSNPLIILFALYFLFPANLLIYGVNDIYDYETDRLNPKKNGYEDLLRPEQHERVWKAIMQCNFPFLIFIYWVPLSAVGALMFFWLFAFFYSAPPIRAKARPFLDSFFSAGHYVATGVFGYLLASSFGAPDWSITLAALLWCMAMHAYSAIPDIQADTQAGLQTIATKLGAKNTLLVCTALYALAAMLSFSTLGWASASFGVAYIVLMGLSYARSDRELLALYRVFPWINGIIGGMITLSLVGTVAL